MYQKYHVLASHAGSTPTGEEKGGHHGRRHLHCYLPYSGEKNTTCWGRVSDDTLARYAPDGAFAFIRSDRGGVTYIDGEVLSVDRLVLLGKLMLAEKIVADGAVYAVRIKDTRLWAPYYLIDRVVTTSR